MCGLGQVLSALWASISPTAKYNCDGGRRVVTLKRAFFVLLPPSDSLNFSFLSYEMEIMMSSKSAQVRAVAAGLGGDAAVEGSVWGRGKA